MVQILRKLTAILLLTLMMVVTATSQGGVFYCLCLHTLTVGHCGCEEVDEHPQTVAEVPVVEEHPCHCCHESESVEELQPTVCPHDCNVELCLALGDFCGTSPPFPALDENPGVGTLSQADWENRSFSPGSAACHWSSRAPPDPERPQAVPLYLRHLVFLV